eukprot:Nk52_evm46s78 gene=Nk52_evmTU46s78
METSRERIFGNAIHKHDHDRTKLRSSLFQTSTDIGIRQSPLTGKMELSLPERVNFLPTYATKPFPKFDPRSQTIDSFVKCAEVERKLCKQNIFERAMTNTRLQRLLPSKMLDPTPIKTPNTCYSIHFQPPEKANGPTFEEQVKELEDEEEEKRKAVAEKLAHARRRLVVRGNERAKEILDQLQYESSYERHYPYRDLKGPETNLTRNDTQTFWTDLGPENCRGHTAKNEVPPPVMLKPGELKDIHSVPISRPVTVSSVTETQAAYSRSGETTPEPDSCKLHEIRQNLMEGQEKGLSNVCKDMYRTSNMKYGPQNDGDAKPSNSSLKNRFEIYEKQHSLYQRSVERKIASGRSNYNDYTATSPGKQLDYYYAKLGSVCTCGKNVGGNPCIYEGHDKSEICFQHRTSKAVTEYGHKYRPFNSRDEPQMDTKSKQVKFREYGIDSKGRIVHKSVADGEQHDLLYSKLDVASKSEIEASGKEREPELDISDILKKHSIDVDIL